ncbi:helix-turn-helix domain-containing protein [Clostridium grantii]|uniref:Helix-turn-helix domain-containing protein n=1 Tax=Clostridium grantii DSM 8605 TaxID=1121316 RepID=A0A1M5UAL6_9CLOT|nr:AraC family transcriptional regulator [Clostridium grantii]SHH60062.1 Helix-turn-helix domain-containing protein [Clostridium grantii DSM 8605]
MMNELKIGNKELIDYTIESVLKNNCNNVQTNNILKEEKLLSHIVDCDEENFNINYEVFIKLMNCTKDTEYVLILFGIDNYFVKNNAKVFYSEKMYLEELKKYINEFEFEKNKMNLVVCEKRKSSMLILMMFGKDNIDKWQIINNYIKKIKERLSSRGISLSIGISKIHKRFKKISLAYEECKKALDFRFYMGKNSVFIFDENILNEYVKKKNEYNIKINNILKNIEIRNEKNMEKCIIELMDEMEEDKLYPENFRKIIYFIIISINNSYIQNLKTIDIIFGDIEEVYYCVDKIDTYEELRGYAINKIHVILQKYRLRKNTKNKNIIEDSMNYIKNNYMKEITLKIVAEEVYLTPNYFSQIFKSQAGMNFIDFLIECRIGQAKKLLKQPGIKIYEIAELVGYKEIVSFNRAFKKSCRDIT